MNTVELEKAFVKLLAEGFNPVGYTLEGKAIIVYDPADCFKELYTVSTQESLKDSMSATEAALKNHLLNTKQYQYIKRAWVSALPPHKVRSCIEMIDEIDHTCLHCNRGIPAGYTYWVYQMRASQLDEPDRDFLTYCDDCVQEQLYDKNMDTLCGNEEDEPWKHADD